MGLFDLLKNKRRQEAPVAEPKVDEMKPYPDGRIPGEWLCVHKYEFDDFKDAVLSHSQHARDCNNPIDERVDSFRSLMSLYEEKESYFLSRSECHAAYFKAQWLDEPDGQMSYIDKCKEDFAKLLDDYPKLKRHETLVATLDDDLMAYLEERSPVIQSKIYEDFDQAIKESISERLYRWSKDGRIAREKHGRSCLVSLPEKTLADQPRWEPR